VYTGWHTGMAPRQSCTVGAPERDWADPSTEMNNSSIPEMKEVIKTIPGRYRSMHSVLQG
jgi:hypothetical protein